MSYPNLPEIKLAADDYWQVWQELLTQAPKLRHVIGQHTPTALGWKVEGNMAPLEAAAQLYELGDSLFAGPVDGERSILTIHKPRPVVLASVQDLKIMQRRPSKPGDKLGADSLDLYLAHGLPKLDALKAALAGVDATCELERNAHHEWLSLRFDGHEFKLKDHHIWEVCVRQAQALLG